MDWHGVTLDSISSMYRDISLQDISEEMLARHANELGVSKLGKVLSRESFLAKLAFEMGHFDEAPAPTIAGAESCGR